MIQYNPKEWFSFIFRFHRADTFRRLLPMMGCIAAYCVAVEYLEVGYLHLSDTSRIRHLSVVHTLLGFALSMLLVFRTNTAYERWWEGRRLWGSLVNASRNLALKLQVLVPSAADRVELGGLLAFYALAVKHHLRGQPPPPGWLLPGGMAPDPARHVPNQVAAAVFRRLVELGLPGDRLLLLNSDLQVLTDVCGGCERIRNTPIPFSYSAFLKKFIFIYVMTLPVSYSVSLDWMVIPVVVLIFYALASLELIAEEIENPFGTDPNDLPLDDLCQVIGRSTAELLGSRPSPPG